MISYFLPFAREIRESSRLAGLPSEEWVFARIDGETFNKTVRGFIIDLLTEMGPIPSRLRTTKCLLYAIEFPTGRNGIWPMRRSRGLSGCTGADHQERHGGAFWQCDHHIGAVAQDNKTCGNYIDAEVKPQFSPLFGFGNAARPCRVNTARHYRFCYI